jgi:hypothetical protein
VSIDRVATWPAPLYWQATVPAVQLDNVDAGVTPGQESPRTATGAQFGVAAVFVAITPCRLADTRGDGFTGAFGSPAMAAGTTRVFPVPAGSCGLPSTAVAYSFNIAVVPVGATMRWLTAWPDGETMPTLATLNDKAGLVTSNAAVVAAGNNGAVDIFVEDATNVIIDVNGYYALPGSLPMTGTAAAPALTFGDVTTGLFSIGAGSVSIATEGVTALTVGPTGDLDMSGSITKGGIMFLHNLGINNLSVGLGALSNGPGINNTAVGFSTLENSSGAGNTAVGVYAGYALDSSSNSNTAVGAGTLFNGSGLLYNAAVGSGALNNLTAGNYNTALGGYAGSNVASGTNNTYVGYLAAGNTNAIATTATETGSYNTFIGSNAGVNATTGSYNIFIANQGTGSPDTESNTTRIGDTNQSRTFISGIRGVTTGSSGAIAVVIDANGQLGTVSSSRRVKTDIAAMGDTTETLMNLRPVQFRYIAHGPDAPLQYGLIAEEVAEVAPDLVARKADGEVETVYYDKVNAMLLNQVQAQQRKIESQDAQIGAQREQFTTLIAQLESRLAELERRAK